MSVTQTLTMPGQVNTDIGIKPYAATDPIHDVEITTTTTHDNDIYNVLASSDKGKFFVQKISATGQKDSTWGSGSPTDFSVKDFVIFEKDKSDPLAAPVNYSWTGCKIDKMYPQSISIHNDRVYIVGNTKYDVTNCIPIGGDGSFPAEFPPEQLYPTLWQGDPVRGFLVVLKLSDGQIDTDYYNKAWGGNGTTIPPLLDNKGKKYFGSSSTLFTSRNKELHEETGWSSNMPTYSIALSLDIFTTGADKTTDIIDNLDAGDFLVNFDDERLNSDVRFNCSVKTADNAFLIVGSQRSYIDNTDSGLDKNTSIVVRAYKDDKLEPKLEFAEQKANGTGVVSPPTTDAILRIDPQGTALNQRVATLRAETKCNTITIQESTGLLPGDITFIMAGSVEWGTESPVVIPGPWWQPLDIATFEHHLPFLCKFNGDGTVDNNFSSNQGTDPNLCYLGNVGSDNDKYQVTSIAPNLPDSDTSIIVLKKEYPTESGCRIQKAFNTGTSAYLDTTFGNSGTFSPTISDYTILTTRQQLLLNNTCKISVFGNDCYLALTGFKNDDTQQVTPTGLVTKFTMDGDPSHDFGTGGYALFGPSNTSYDKVNTQSVVLVGYLLAPAYASIGWTFGSGAKSPNQPIGIPFNLLPSSGICFPAGTPINTDQGIKNIEDISTRKNTINGKKINSITKTIMKRLDYLVVLEKDCIEKNVPSQQTICSPDHKILYRDKMIEASLLIERKVRGVYAKKYDKSPLYNVLLDSHSTMIVNNMITETLHPKNPIAMLYSNIPQSVKNRAMIYNNLKENEIQLNPNKSFLLQKHVPKPVAKERPKLEFSFSLKR
jgi:hypothetical protein